MEDMPETKVKLINAFLFLVLFWGPLISSWFTEDPMYKAVAITVASIVLMVNISTNTIIYYIKKK